jgi:cell wall assembly regulator SMI1
MHLAQVVQRFDSLSHQGIVCRLAHGATEEVIRDTEARLGLRFPEQVASFWVAFDGLEVDVPPFKILPLSEMKREGELVVFCICNRTIRIAFDVREANEAGQWSILNADTGYCITLTMASFWSTHMWSWIVKHRPIWYDVHNSSGNQHYIM